MISTPVAVANTATPAPSSTAATPAPGPSTATPTPTPTPTANVGSSTTLFAMGGGSTGATVVAAYPVTASGKTTASSLFTFSGGSCSPTFSSGQLRFDSSTQALVMTVTGSCGAYILPYPFVAVSSLANRLSTPTGVVNPDVLYASAFGKSGRALEVWTNCPSPATVSACSNGAATLPAATTYFYSAGSTASVGSVVDLNAFDIIGGAAIDSAGNWYLAGTFLASASSSTTYGVYAFSASTATSVSPSSGRALGISTGQTQNGVYVDASDNVYVCSNTVSSGSTAGQIQIYSSYASGNALQRTISGSNTLIGSTGCGAMATDAAGNLYVGSGATFAVGNAFVAVFNSGAAGNVAPDRTIQLTDFNGTNFGVAVK